MDNEEIFKNKLRSLVESKEFPYDERGWEGALKLLNADRSRKGGAGLFIAGLLFICAGLLTSSGHAPEQIAPRTAAHAVPVPPTHLSQSNPETSPESPPLAPAPRQAPARKAVATSIPPARTAPAQPPAKPEPAVVNPPVADVTPGLERKSEDRSWPPPKKQAAQEKPLPAGEQPAVKNESPAVPVDPGALQSPPVASNGDPKSPDTKPVPTNETSPVEPLKNETPVLQSNDPVTRNIETPKENAATAAAPLPVENASQAPEPLAAAPDKAPVETPSTQTQTPIQPTVAPPPHLLLSLEAGTSYNLGWMESGVREGAGFNPVFGFSYYTPAAENLYFSAGLHYTSVGHLAASSYTSRVTSYRLGEETDVTVFTPSTLHYLTVPLRMQKLFGEKHMVGAGVNLSYLLNVSANVQSYHENAFGKGPVTQSKASGYTEGFGWYDAQLAAFYRYRIYKGLAAGAEMFFGLNTVKETYFFRPSNPGRSMGLKLQLIYNIYSTDKK